MNSDLSNLRELQAVDREILRLKQEIASLPRRVAAIEDKLADARARKQQAEAALKADEAARRKYESQIQDLRQKISKYRDQMLAVKTNEQYKALTHEVQFAESEIRSCEDKILEGMVDAEQKEKQVKVADADLKTETAEIEKEKAAARIRTEEDQALLATADKRRTELRSAISSDVLHQYERVARLRGTGLAEAIDHRCSACQVLIRPQMWNDIRTTGQVMYCDSCQRILVYDVALQTPPPEDKTRKPAKDAEIPVPPATS
ncbi:MAG: zinc ribbon domain-containing protein [Candidatus Korobacteraceae bacterium]